MRKTKKLTPNRQKSEMHLMMKRRKLMPPLKTEQMEQMKETKKTTKDACIITGIL